MKTALVHGPKQRFCDNCGALLINFPDCPECGPYQRMVIDCDTQIDSMRQRRTDATNKLVELKQKRREGIERAIEVN